MASRFWVGGTGTWDSSTTTHWASSSNGSGGASVPGSSDTVTFDASSGGGTVTVGASYNPSVVSITMGAFTGTLDFSVNNNSPTMQTFSGTGTGTRTLKMGSGTWTLTGSGATIWNTSTSTNLTLTVGTSTVDCTYSGSTGTRTINVNVALNNVKISAGSDSVTTTGTFFCNDLNFTGFTGTWNSAQVNTTGNITLGTGMTATSGANVLNFVGTSGTQIFRSNSVQFNRPITINAPGATVQLFDNLDMGGAGQRTLTLSQGTFDANNKNITCGAFNSNNSNTRTLTMGSGTWTIVGNSAAIWNLATVTNLTLTPSSNAVVCNYSGSTGTRAIRTGVLTESTSPSFNFTAGSDVLDLATAIKNLNLTGFSGSISDNVGKTMYGNLTIPNTVTSISAGRFTFSATSGTQTITTSGVTINAPITINAPGANFQLVDHLNMTGNTLILTAGTFDANNKNVTCDQFQSGNSNTRTLTMGNGTWTITGSGSAWYFSTITGLTLTPNSSTIKMTDSTSSTKTIVGGGLTFNNLWLSDGGTGVFAFTGSNTFNDLKIDAGLSATFAAGSTTTVSSFTASGTLGNVISLHSATPDSQWNISKSSGLVECSYLNLQDSNATGGAIWKAHNSTNTSDNTGWLFDRFLAAMQTLDPLTSYSALAGDSLSNGAAMLAVA